MTAMHRGASQCALYHLRCVRATPISRGPAGPVGSAIVVPDLVFKVAEKMVLSFGVVAKDQGTRFDGVTLGGFGVARSVRNLGLVGCG